MTATPERCPRCDQVRAVENGHPGGCLCESCVSMCWRDWGVECNAIDWRQRALVAEQRADAAEAREAGLRARVEAPALTVGAWFSQIVEVQYDGGWYQLRADGYERWWRKSAVDLAWKWSMWMIPGGSVVREVLAIPCRLVPIDEADADPATRGPIGGGR